MMDLLLATSGGEAQVAGGGYVDDVFSAYTYTGNGSTQTINNGIDLAGKGGLVWTKTRGSTNNHALIDSARGFGVTAPILSSDLTSASSSIGTTSLSATSSGYTLGNSSGYVNGNGSTYVSWTFRRAPKFFDVVAYTGNGASNRALSHQLNADVGMIMVKATSTTGDWLVFHRSATGDLVLNTTAAQTGSKANIPSATSSTFTVNGSANTNGVQYVAYLFTHDQSAEGIIQCGSFTTDASGNATVNLGWANGSQFAMIKAASTTGDWEMYDTARTSAWSGNDARLRANLSNAEDSVARISASGTSITFAGLSANSTYIYTVVRSPS